MKYYILIVLASLSFALCCNIYPDAQTTSKNTLKKKSLNKQQTNLSADEDPSKLITPEEFNKTKMSQEEMEIFKESINRMGKQITIDLKKKGMSGIDIMSKSSLIEFWSDNINLQNATGIDREWYKKVSEQLRKLGNYKNAMEISEEHKKYEQYKEYSNKYDEQLQEYLMLIKAPEKVKVEEIETE